MMTSAFGKKHADSRRQAETAQFLQNDEFALQKGADLKCHVWGRIASDEQNQ